MSETIHRPLRLRIMAALNANNEVDFTFLRDLLEVTDGNLGAHLRRLEGTGYIAVSKTFVDREPRAYVSAGKLVYHVRFEGNALSVPGGFILSSLSFFGIGFILAGTLPTARTAQIVAMVLLYPMLILSGAAWPRELMPATVRKISAFVPLTYVVNLLRGLWIGETWGGHLLDVGVLAGKLLLGIIVSAKTFRWE